MLIEQVTCQKGSFLIHHTIKNKFWLKINLNETFLSSSEKGKTLDIECFIMQESGINKKLPW